MLSSSTEIEEIVAGESKDCGDDSFCFDKSFRICQPTSFYPDSMNNDKSGMEVIIEGVDEEGNCILSASIPEGETYTLSDTASEMTCEIEDYAIGAQNPEASIFPYCEGDMAGIAYDYYEEGPA